MAVLTILPRLGFTEIYHLSESNRFFPFDIAATFKNGRLLVDVTTGTEKSLRRQKVMASALRMKFVILFVKPDLKSYQLVSRFESDYVAIRLGELRKIA